jgi:hypothetical protein
LVKITRRWLGAALTPVAFGAGAALIIGTLTGSPHATHDSTRIAASVQAYRSRNPALVDCLGHGQVRPASITLSCADGYSSLIGLHWRSWDTSAYGEGTWLINDCTPFCARGTMHRYPVDVVLWAPTREGHVPAREYTKLTMFLPDSRCYTDAGQHSCYPAMSTRDLVLPHQLPPPMNVQVSMVPLTTVPAERLAHRTGHSRHVPPRTLTSHRRPAPRHHTTPVHVLSHREHVHGRSPVRPLAGPQSDAGLRAAAGARVVSGSREAAGAPAVAGSRSAAGSR